MTKASIRMSQDLSDVVGIGRRTLLTQAVMVGGSIGALGLFGLAQGAQAAATPQQPEAETGHSYPMARPDARTEMEFRMGVIGPAMLSLVTSQLAVDKATDRQAKEFANFELREAIAVTTVLSQLRTPVPAPDANARATRARIEGARKGRAFDREYMTAQLANHEFLRDLAASYLINSANATSMPEMHGRHLATLAQSTFKEHVVHCKRITEALRA
ncbi:DUF4142 domain-containing protein [Sphingomonas ginkgonis]|uniref:DUF4142 domain-containing protein n=1 Tax=Sphingomonas ginkgonis TaxID=2315330 RepID=A0A429V678_9SPHN|nr:DUF4142 domain-containing protein [Sphingomonas ginkgonis]RST29458.1 DUF4142 domain-containing protein [Sphingomonas ginkgonis]